PFCSADSECALIPYSNWCRWQTRTAISSLYQPGRAPSPTIGCKKAPNPRAIAGMCAIVLNMLGTTPRCASKASYMAPSSGETWSRSSIGIRPCFSAFTLESISQRELDHARVTEGRNDLRKRTLVLEVGRGRIGEVRVIPDVEEISLEA